MPVQQTLDTADAVVSLINAAGLTEGIIFARVFVPEFEADELTSPKGVVVASSMEIENASRTTDHDDHSIEIGIGRRLSNEAADMATHLLTLEEVLGVIRDRDNAALTVSDGEIVRLKGAVQVRLYDPAHVVKRVALSVLRVIYRG